MTRLSSTSMIRTGPGGGAAPASEGAWRTDVTPFGESLESPATCCRRSSRSDMESDGTSTVVLPQASGPRSGSRRGQKTSWSRRRQRLDQLAPHHVDSIGSQLEATRRRMTRRWGREQPRTRPGEWTSSWTEDRSSAPEPAAPRSSSWPLAVRVHTTSGTQISVSHLWWLDPNANLCDDPPA